MKDATAFEAAAFRRLLQHLDARKDVQNIELMTLAGFCRNCLADWYREAAQAAGVAIDRDAAREIVYGMPARCHSPTWRQASRSTQSPSGTIIPRSSAIGMNSEGLIQPM